MATTDVAAAVENVLDQDGAPIIRAGLDGHISQQALDHLQDMTGAVRDALAATRQLEADLADLDRRRDLLPVDGYDRVVRDARRDAHEKSSEAQRAAKRAYEQLEQALVADALPKLDPSREKLARDEATLALSGDGPPETAALDIAANGSDEALAVLLSTSYGRTLLASKGVRNVDDTLRRIRETAHHRVLARADTPAAQLLRDHYGGLGSALGGVRVASNTAGKR